MGTMSARLMNSEHVGSIEPRLWTPPLRELTPQTSYGYDVIEFALEVLETDLDDWQKWLLIHIGELLPDMRPRFRYVLALVARQNGKTTLGLVLTLFWMFLEEVPLILGTSTNRGYAKIAWEKVIDWAKSNPHLKRELDAKSERRTTGEESFKTIRNSEYRFAAANGQAGRSLTVHRLIIDEIREHDTFKAWGAATNAMNAVKTAQAFAISNQGDETAIVLDSLRDAALNYIETGEGDPRTGLFEWSAPDGCDPCDVDALAQANPDLGNRLQLDSIMSAAIRAKNSGGEELATFRTEVLCQRVKLLDPAIDPDKWKECAGVIANLAEYRDNVALCLDVSLDRKHAAIVAAAQIGAQCHVDVVAATEQPTEIVDMLKEWVHKVKPRIYGWFPQGPAAAITADLQTGWEPKGTELREVRGEVIAACMGISEQVKTLQIVHPSDPLLDAHVEQTQKLSRGDGFVFTRKGSGSIDASYALAGAVHLARTIPPPRPKFVAL